jgi:predicted dehydrogenase
VAVERTTAREPSAAAPTTVGVVGLGYWGPNLLRVLAEMADVRVKWTCDLDRERLDRFRQRYPAIATTRHVETVLDDPEVDAVFLATPVFTHFDLASRSLRADKHTFVEKPLAPTTEMAEELRRLADEHDRRLMCGHTFIYSPPVRTLKRMLEREELGTVFFVSSSRVNLGLHQRDISVVWDLGPHDFSILLYWLEEMPSSVRAVGRDSIVRGIPDVAFVTLTFPSGIVASVELSWLAPSKLRRTVVVGSEKMVVYDDGTSEPLRIFDHGVVYQDPETFGQYHLAYRTGDILSPKVATYEPLVAELADFIRAVRSGESMDWQTRLAKDVVRLTEAADRSLREGGAEVSVDKPLFASMRPREVADAVEGSPIP